MSGAGPRMDDQRTDRKSGYRMSRGLKVFLVLLISFALWMTVVDSFWMVPQYALPMLGVLLTAIVLILVRIAREE